METRVPMYRCPYTDCNALTYWLEVRDIGSGWLRATCPRCGQDDEMELSSLRLNQRQVRIVTCANWAEPHTAEGIRHRELAALGN